jgi:hypothetical protein
VDDDDHGPYYVRVTGWLLLDSMHVANTTHATAWELHPSTAFEICTTTKTKCDKGNDWQKLEDFQTPD